MWALEGDLGLGRKAGLATGPKLGEGAGRGCGRVRGCPGTEPGLHHYSGDEMRADPRSYGEQPLHAGLDLPGESASPCRSKVGFASARPEAGRGPALLSLRSRRRYQGRW